MSAQRQRRRALLKPFELLSISAVFAVFVFGVFLLSTRNPVTGSIAAGVVFIISTVVLAMLVLSYRPNAEVPVYLDRDQAASEEPGAKESALKVDVDAALAGERASSAGDGAADAGDAEDANAAASGEAAPDAEEGAPGREQPPASDDPRA